MNSADCKAQFRVEKADLPRLADGLRKHLWWFGGTVCAAETNKLSLQIQRSPRPVSALSLITNEVMDFIYDNHCHLVKEWNRNVLSSVALQQ